MAPKVASGLSSGAHVRMATLLAGLALAAPDAHAAGPEASTKARAPVLLELFTSEGCSSCPPADALLAQLDGAGAVDGTPVIALELHVDYWNDLGWRDPFSAAAFSERQARYTRWLGTRGNYTPQLVVDGRSELVGSDRARAIAAIAAAGARSPKASVQLARHGERLYVRITGVTEPQYASAYLAITEQGLRTQVERGENAGKLLPHAPVVRSLRSLGVMTVSGYDGEVPLALPKGSPLPALRAVVFVQGEADGKIWGAGALPLALALPPPGPGPGPGAAAGSPGAPVLAK